MPGCFPNLCHTKRCREQEFSSNLDLTWRHQKQGDIYDDFRELDCAVQRAGDVVDKFISSGVSSPTQCDSDFPCDTECRMFGKFLWNHKEYYWIYISNKNILQHVIYCYTGENSLDVETAIDLQPPAPSLLHSLIYIHTLVIYFLTVNAFRLNTATFSSLVSIPYGFSFQNSYSHLMWCIHHPSLCTPDFLMCIDCT
jgi:hypothetical protein